MIRFPSSSSDSTQQTNEKATSREELYIINEGPGPTYVCSLSMHWRSAAVAFLVSLCIIMETYSMNLLSILFINHDFLQEFGNFNAKANEWEIAPWQQSALFTSLQCGVVVGLLWAGYSCDRLGYRFLILKALSASLVLPLVTVLAQSFLTICIGQFLLGIPFGMFQALTVAYANEICPRVLRGVAASTLNINAIFGQLLSSCVMLGLENRADGIAWRGGFVVVTCLSAVLGFLIIIFAPQSPVWLIREHRTEDAKQVLRHFTRSGPKCDEYVEERLQETSNTLAQEERMKEISCTQMMRGVDLRRTTIVIGVWAILAVCGFALLRISAFFFKHVGLTERQSLLMTIGQHCLSILGTVLSWILMLRINRRPILITGLAVASILHIIMGILGCFSARISISWPISIIFLIFSFNCNLAIAPVVYSIIPKIPSNLLRPTTLSFARIVYIFLNIINYSLVPQMSNPEGFNLGVKTGFFFLGTSLICLVCTYFFVPETKGFTTQSIDWLFGQRVPERHFTKITLPPGLQLPDH